MPAARATHRQITATALLLASTGVGAFGQPTNFIDLGAISPPDAPPQARVVIDDGSFVRYQSPPVVLSVQWVRFQLLAPISGERYLDIDGRNYNGVGVTYAIYDGAGSFIAADDTDGSFPYGGAPGLSFGSTDERVPWSGPANRGQDGSLAPGIYWLALVAGSVSQITFGPSWGISTPVTLPIGYDEGQLDLEASVVVGNTTPYPRPPNDDCAGALVVSENIGQSPAWIGNNLGATQDGFSTCYTAVDNLTYKDIWFNYVPSATGWVTMTLGGGAGGGATPILTRYNAGCGSIQVRCAGGGSFVSPVGTRLTFPVTQGQPVLLAAAIRAGSTGPLRLDINLLGQPCDLQTPTDAIPEIETACGESLNEGCSLQPAGYDLIQMGETVRGRLFNTRTTRDVDHFLLHLPMATNFRVTAAAQLPFDIIVRGFSPASGCPSGVLVAGTSESYLNLCQPVSISGQGVGTYVVSISHDALDEFDCAAGYGDYWIRIDGVDCQFPVFSVQPVDATACAGGEAVFTSVAGAAAPPVLGWEWELVLGNTRLWRPVTNGVFTDAGSGAVVSGATTSTLSITGIDAAAAVRFRATARTCGTARSRPASLGLRSPDQCPPACPGDFNQSGSVTVQDVFDYLFAYFSGLPSADINASGQVTLQDLFDYLVAYFDGCP